MGERDGILQAEIERWRAKSYEELVSLVDIPHHYTRSGDSGAEYGLEAVIVWDGRRSENIRVILDISGWGNRSADFIRAPDGSFVDE